MIFESQASHQEVEISVHTEYLKKSPTSVKTMKTSRVTTHIKKPGLNIMALHAYRLQLPLSTYRASAKFVKNAYVMWSRARVKIPC